MRKMQLSLFVILSLIINIIPSCEPNKNKSLEDCEKILDERLPLLGHRNWLLVVDKAFPLQNGDGIEVIYVDDEILNVLPLVKGKIEASTHVKPVFYNDLELDYLDNEAVAEVKQYREKLYQVLGPDCKKILHDSVFVKIDNASRLFKVLVIKTNEVIPYSSVFIELDCKYWSPRQEEELRKKM